MAQAVLDIKPLAQSIMMHVKLKRVRQWKWRVRLAAWLVQLAAWVMWVNVEVEVEHGP